MDMSRLKPLVSVMLKAASTIPHSSLLAGTTSMYLRAVLSGVDNTERGTAAHPSTTASNCASPTTALAWRRCLRFLTEGD